MSEFDTLYDEVVEMCSFESVSPALNERLGRSCTPQDVGTLIARLETLDRVDLGDDAGDLGDYCWRLRISLSDALTAAGGMAVEPLLAVLNAGDGDAARFAARSLGRLGERRAVPAILSKIESAADHVGRLPYITALGDIQDRSVVDRLLPYLPRSSDPNGGWLVRVTAIVLGTIGDASVVGALGRVLASDGEWFARLGAAEGLGLLGSVEALPLLQSALADRDPRVAQAAQESIALVRSRRPYTNG